MVLVAPAGLLLFVDLQQNLAQVSFHLLALQSQLLAFLVPLAGQIAQADHLLLDFLILLLKAAYLALFLLNLGLVIADLANETLDTLLLVGLRLNFMLHFFL